MSERTESKAADTGSAAGDVCRLIHLGNTFESAMTYAERQWSGADMQLVEKWCWEYANDVRNQTGSFVGDVIAETQEAEVACTVDGVDLVGHVDQIRELNGQWYVWDIKTSRGAGETLVYDYAWQLAGYAVAATRTFGRVVLPGGIIRLRGYVGRGKKDPRDRDVFFYAPWTPKQCESMLGDAVAASQSTIATPGDHCRYCPASGPNHCKEELNDKEKRS